ncbi:hypothetical protein [uncultured Rikenella sp.]|uniref:hypothetical protein n=1 Tax=uncultured Rikenella sp. TaxID=368003 RepID=UPI0025E580B8|nr:hypothetical protein [uncultured Rikenella sp.]
MTADEKRAYEEWYAFQRSFNSGLEVDPNETRSDRRRRIKTLEKEPETWFSYYFPRFYTAAPAPFHTAATRRVLANPEWYEVRAWSRELAKSARTMMEVCYLVLTGRKRTVILTSNTQNNAERLLAPYRAFFESNERVMHDYGVQRNLGLWTAEEFTLRNGAAFRAVGAGQSPRGSRNNECRPDVLLVDDFDTDEECRNPEVLKKKWDWFEQALYPTRSISTPLTVIFCGNVIAEDCCIRRAMDRADHTDIINIRDKHGRSTWPDKNTEKMIDRVLSKISYKAQQGEYYNNPITEGNTFGELTWGQVPPLDRFRFLIAYADPSPSNNARQRSSSTKALVLLGFCRGRYYVIKCFVDNASTDTFVQWFFDLRDWIGDRCPPVYWYIENNTLQDPFYTQVYVPAFAAKGRRTGAYIGITPDTRRKGEKFARIESGLEPLVRLGQLVFNIDEQGNPHMQRLKEQFRLFGPKLSAPADGVDAVEGGIYIVREKQVTLEQPIISIPRTRNSKRY